MKKVLLSEMSWYEAKEAFERTDLAIIPAGANEAYGRHLPLGSDTIVATEKGIMGFPETGIGIYPGLGGNPDTVKSGNRPGRDMNLTVMFG